MSASTHGFLKSVDTVFDNAAKDNMSDMNNYSKILYENFKKI